MEKIVLIIGGLLKSLTWSDLFFIVATLVLILLLVYIIYIVKNDDDEFVLMNEDVEIEDKGKALEDIVNKLEANYVPKPIDLTKYEEEQENTAIISYDELVKRANNNISYEDEYDSGLNDVLVKKVDPTNTSNTQELVDLPKVVMMSYDSEEAFLKALKTLQGNLVR